MSWGWQDLMALGLVAVSAAYLARLARRAVGRTSSGGGCGSGGCWSCPSQAAPTTGPPGSFVAINALGPPTPRR